MPVLEIIGASKRFGAIAAVDRVSLAIEAGEFFALLGPSGCGKTTLLRLIAGFETPDDGRIKIDGADMTAVPPYARPVNMMFQSYALFPHLDVAGNIAFGLRQEGMDRRRRAARVEEMLALVQMTGLGRRRPHELSGGQRQRVALARALAKMPKLLLLDEPLAALDRKLREETRLELTGIQQRVGTTFLVVTHDQEEAFGLASRTTVVNRLDLMNARAQLVDAWRQLAVFGNSLLSTVNIQYHMANNTPIGQSRTASRHERGRYRRCFHRARSGRLRAGRSRQ